MFKTLLVSAGSAATVAAVAAASSANPSEPTLAQVKAAAKYRNVKTALTDGHVPDPAGMCETAAKLRARDHIGPAEEAAIKNAKSDPSPPEAARA